MEIHLSDAEKVFIIHGAQEGMRCDGRGLNDYRPISVETGVLATTNGSARIRLGSTDLLIGVKAELAEVEDMKDYQNRIRFLIDCSPNASPEFAGRGGEEFASDLASALFAAYDNTQVLPDIKRLILSPIHAWKIYVDIMILQFGGNVLDAAAIGVKAALFDTEISEVIIRPADEGKVTIDLAEENRTWKFDVSRVPLFVTVNKMAGVNLLDATLTEEVCARAALWVAAAPCFSQGTMVNEDDLKVTFLRQVRGGALEMDSVEEMIRVGIRTISQINRRLEERLTEAAKDGGNSLRTFLN